MGLFDFVSNLFSNSSSSFGTYNVDTLDRSLSGASNIRGSQFLLQEPRDFKGKSEASILNQHKASIIVDTTLFKPGDLARTQSKYKDIKIQTYTAQQEGQTRLQHGKSLLFDRSNSKVFRLDSAPFLANNPFNDVFYETSNKKIVAEAEDYYAKLSKNQISNSSNYSYLKVGDEALKSIRSDFKNSTGNVYIQTAGFNIRGKNTSNSENLEGLVSDISQVSNRKVFVASPKLDNQVLNKFRDNENISIGRGNTPKTNHFNATIIEGVKGDNIAYIGTRRYTKSSGEEILVRISEKDDAAAYKFFKSQILQTNNFAGITKFSNAQVGSVLSKEATFSLPSTLGPSYFHNIAKYNVGRALGGRSVVGYQDEEGMAAGAYKLSYYQQTEKLLSNGDIPEYIRRFDRQLTTPGLGTYVNQYFMQYGYDRVYKEEFGAVPSFFGLIGAILDKSIGYNSTDTLDVYARRTPMTKDASMPIAGPLENLFTNAANFVTQTTSAVLTYLAIGIPASVVMSHLSQSGLQMVLDKAVNNIGQGDLDNRPKNVIRKAAQLLTIGSSYTGITDSKTFHQVLGEAVDYKSDAENLSRNPGFLTAYNNIFMRKRGSMMFNNILKPFILEVINPYSTHNQEGTQRAYKNAKFTNLLDKLDKFSAAISEEISITKQTDEVSGEFKYVYNNVGYSRQKSVAKAFDDVAAHLPINPLNWGMMKNFTNPKKGSFISLGEIFSLSGLVETFNDVIYGNSFSELAANFEHKDTRGGMYGFKAKLKSIAAAPFSLIGESFNRFWDSRRAINPLLESSKRLRKIEAELIEAGALFWDGSEYKAVARFDQSPDKSAKYFHELLRYEEAYANLKPELQLKMGEKAEEFFSSQRVYSQTLNASSGRYLTNPFLKSRGKLATAAFLTVGIGMAFSDLFNSNQGVSIITQIENNLSANASGVGATSEWKAAPILPFDGGYRYAWSTAFSLGSVAAAAWIAEKTQGITFDMRELHFQDQDLRGAGMSEADINRLGQKGRIGVLVGKIESAITGKQTQLGTAGISAVVAEQLVEGELKIRNVVSVRAKGNFLRNFAFAFFGIQAAVQVSRQAAASGLSFAGWLGQATNIWGGTNLFHTNSKVVGSDFRAIADLENYRNVVLDKVRSGEASTIERLAAYRVGALSRSMSILGGGKSVRSANSASLVGVSSSSGQTQVIAKQAPLPFIQFFEAETIKGRSYNPDGSVKDGGISTWTAGIQSGPAMGMTLSFGLPIAYDWRGEGGAFGTGIIYSDEKENILTYLKSIGTMTGSSIVAGMATIGFLNIAELATRLPGLSNINAGFKQGIGNIKDILNAVYTLAEYAAEAPKWAARTFIGIGKADYQLVQQLSDPTTFSNFIGAQDTTKKPNRFRPTFTNVLRAGIGAGIGYHLADWIVGTSDSKRTEEENKVIHNNAKVLGSVSGFAAGYVTDPLLKMGRESMDRILATPMMVNLTEKVAPITKFKGVASVVAATFLAGVLATDSNFGISVNMDTDEQGNRDTMKQIMTAALFSATVSIPVITLANVGKSPADAVKRYYELSRATGWDPTRSLRLALLNREVKAYDQLLKESVVARSYEKANDKTKDALITLEQKMSSNRMINLNHHKVDATVMDNLSTVLTSKEYLRYASQRGPFYSRLFLKAPTAIGLTALAGTIVLGVAGLMAGGSGEGVIPRAYDVMDRQTGAVGFFTRPIADVLRLITLRDGAGYRRGYELFTDSAGVGRGSKPIMGTKLIAPYNPKGQGIDAAMQAMQQDFSMGPMNSFQQVTPGFGITFRPSEDGGRVSGYVQIQSMAQDMSTSVYSMAPSFLFAQAANGRGDLGIIIRESVKGVGIKGISNSVAANIYELTGTLPSLEAAKRRRFTQISLSSLDSKLAGDRLLTLMLTDRQRRMSQLSYQPLASIISRASNLREPSLSSMFGSKVNISRPTDSINPNMSKEDKEILSNPTILKALYIQLLNPLNKVDLISVRKSIIDPDANEKTTQETGMSETSEWIEYTGNNAGPSPFQRPGIFSSILAAKSNFENFTNRLPFGGVLTTAFYASLVISGVVGSVATATSLMTNKATDALTDLVDKNRNLFGDVHKQGISSEMFRIERLGKGDREYVVRKGNTYYQISPDSQSFVMQTSNAQLEGMQRRIQGGTDALWEELHLLTNDSQTKAIFDPGNPNNAGIGRSAYVTQVSEVYTGKLGTYVDKLAQELKEMYQTLGVTFSEDAFVEVKKELLSKVENTISTEISKNFTREGALLNRYRGLDLEGSSQYLSKMVLKDIKYFFDGIRSNLLGLQPTELHLGEVIIKEAEDALKGGTLNSPLSNPAASINQSSTVSKASGFSGVSAPSSAVPSKLPKASASLQWLKSAGKAVNALFTINEIADAFDVYGSYARLAGAYESNETTEAQRKVLGLHAAQTSGTFLATTAFVAGSNVAMSWLSSTFALTGSGLFGTSVTTVAGAAAAGGGAATVAGGVGVAATAPISIPVLGLIAIAAAVIGVGFAMRKQIGEGLHAVSQTRLWKGFSNTVEDGMQSMAKVGAGLIMGGANNVNKWSGGLISKGTFVTSLGMTQAAILIGLVAAPALIAGGAVASIGLGYVGVSAAIGLLGGLVGGSIPGFNKTMGGFAAWAQESAAQIPLIGGFLATPLGMLYSRKDIQFNGPGSPIYSASVDQAIQYESKKYLTASTDATGQRTRALFTSPNHYGSNYEASDPWAAQSTLRPRGVMDPMIDREIAVRAQYYNQSIIGQRIWREIIKNAANYPALLQLEKDKYRNDPNVRAYQSTVKAKMKKDGEVIAKSMASSDTTVQKQAYAAATQVTGKSGTPAQKTRKAILVDSKRIANADLRAKTQALAHVIGFNLLHETEIKVTKEGNTTTVKETPSADNDMYHAITGGRVSHLPAYMSS